MNFGEVGGGGGGGGGDGKSMWSRESRPSNHGDPVVAPFTKPEYQTGTVAVSQGQNSDSQGKFNIDVPLHEIIDYEGKSNPSYSMVSVATMNRENTYTRTLVTSKTASKIEKCEEQEADQFDGHIG